MKCILTLIMDHTPKNNYFIHPHNLAVANENYLADMQPVYATTVIILFYFFKVFVALVAFIRQ